MFLHCQSHSKMTCNVTAYQKRSKDTKDQGEQRDKKAHVYKGGHFVKFGLIHLREASRKFFQELAQMKHEKEGSDISVTKNTIALRGRVQKSAKLRKFPQRSGEQSSSSIRQCCAKITLPVRLPSHPSCSTFPIRPFMKASIGLLCAR